MELKHVVVTSVDRDDVPDRGAGALRGDDPRAQGEAPGRLGRGADAGLPRRRGGGAAHGARRAARGLQPQHRDRAPPAPADARREGELRRRALAAAPREGARRLPGADEVAGSSSASARRTTRSSRRCATCARTASTSSRSASTCSRRAKHAPIDRWVHPDEFRWFREQGEALGFGSVFSGPLVRSSYRADEQRHAGGDGVGAAYPGLKGDRALASSISRRAARRRWPQRDSGAYCKIVSVGSSYMTSAETKS